MPSLPVKSEFYRGYVIEWLEPPMTGAGWTANITSESMSRAALLGRRGAEVVTGSTREAMLDTAYRYINNLLDA